MLTGDSSDELWGGYGTFLSFRLNQLIKTKTPSVPGARIFNHLIPGLQNAGIESLHHLVSPFDSRFLKPFLDFGLFGLTREQEWQKCRKAYDFLGDEYNTNVNAFLLDEARSRLERFMVRSDRVGMANSIELRLPFLTKEMFGLAANIPFQRKSRFAPSVTRRSLFWDKAPLRDMAIGVGVSNEIVKRPKIGTPSGEVNIQNLNKIISTFDFTSFERLFGLRKDQCRQYISYLRFPALAERLSWTFLSMEMLLRLFVENQSPFEIEDELSVLLRKKI
jgi:asparagine synthetase B (glutamine-hydrolysing)